MTMHNDNNDKGAIKLHVFNVVLDRAKLVKMKVKHTKKKANSKIPKFA
jgi:hypothetical protein